MKYYTGVGSRETPTYVKTLMTGVARMLEGKGYTLRSGGAKGADYAFEIGTSTPDIYSVSKKHKPVSGKPSIIPDLEKYRELAKKCCLHYNNIHSQYAKDLHTRNICQVIGHHEGIVRSDFLLAYTLNGDYVGGTTTAIRCAERFDVPVFNFGTYDCIEKMDERMEKIKQDLTIFLKTYMK